MLAEELLAENTLAKSEKKEKRSDVTLHRNKISQCCSFTGGWSNLLGFLTFSEGTYFTLAPYRPTSLVLSLDILMQMISVLYLPRL